MWPLFYDTVYGILHQPEDGAEHASLHYLWHQLNGVLKWQGKQNQELWHMARQQGYWSIIPHMDSRKAKTFKPQQLLLFPWEQKEKRKALKQIKK